MKHILKIVSITLLLISCNSTQKNIKAVQIMNTETITEEIATFGGGCFWCIEAIFDSLKGVEAVTSGYAGGITENPTYKEVCTEDTKHVEVVQVKFNPTIITYSELVDILFHVHDPTTLNRQGNDVGEQYRSVIFHHSEKQKTEAEKVLKTSQASGLWGNSAYTTTIEEAPKFYSAEEYHQNYFENNPKQPYCEAVVSPKVLKFREKYKALLKEGF